MCNTFKNKMTTLPFLPTEIIDKINKMAYDMKVAEDRELNRAVSFNNCMKWIEYECEDYLDDWGAEAEDEYDHLWEHGAYVLRLTNFYQYLKHENILS